MLLALLAALLRDAWLANRAACLLLRVAPAGCRLQVKISQPIATLRECWLCLPCQRQWLLGGVLARHDDDGFRMGVHEFWRDGIRDRRLHLHGGRLVRYRRARRRVPDRRLCRLRHPLPVLVRELQDRPLRGVPVGRRGTPYFASNR